MVADSLDSLEQALKKIRAMVNEKNFKNRDVILVGFSVRKLQFTLSVVQI